jgi:hypothetical protein
MVFQYRGVHRSSPRLVANTFMDRTRTRWLLFTALLFLLPVPFFLVEFGRVPPARLFQLTGTLVALVAAEGGQGAVVPAALLIGVQAVFYATVAYAAAAVAQRLLDSLGRPVARIALFALVACGVVFASAAAPYVTPFSVHASQSNLLGVFR